MGQSHEAELLEAGFPRSDKDRWRKLNRSRQFFSAPKSEHKAINIPHSTYLFYTYCPWALATTLALCSLLISASACTADPTITDVYRTSPENAVHFGESLVIGHFNGAGYKALAVSSP